MEYPITVEEMVRTIEEMATALSYPDGAGIRPGGIGDMRPLILRRAADIVRAAGHFAETGTNDFAMGGREWKKQ